MTSPEIRQPASWASAETSPSPARPISIRAASLKRRARISASTCAMPAFPAMASTKQAGRGWKGRPGLPHRPRAVSPAAMQVVGDYAKDGYAHLKGLIPPEVGQAFLQGLKQD